MTESQFKIGERAVILHLSWYDSSLVGDIVSIDDVLEEDGTYNYRCYNEAGQTLYIWENSLGKVLTMQKEEDFVSVIVRMEADFTDTRDKLAWMRSCGIKEFNEKKYRAWQAVQALKDCSLSDMDKAEKILELFKK